MPESRQKSQEIRDYILKNIPENRHNITSITANHFGISRQAVLRHIRYLITNNKILAHGSTRDRYYELKPIANFSIVLKNSPDLEEDKIWREEIRPHLKGVQSNVFDICMYGFTEMLNNVIDHSGANIVTINLNYSREKIQLDVMDDGIGIFRKIQKELNLEDHIHAVLELSKGKLTTDPEHHTGEGIFFTARMFDSFSILSSELFFLHKKDGYDWILETYDKTNLGTLISMEISTDSERTAKSVFDTFVSSEDDYDFSKTRVPVNLARYGNENLISRSQAKRLLARFDRFKEVVLNFKDVEMIGQAFADEIFRVFQKQYPQIHLYSVNANDQVTKMIKRALEYR